MVIDTIPFFNELDILEIRLEELYDVVDRFVLQESTLTFSNQPKPLYFQENRERFARFKSKLETHVLDYFDGAPRDNPMAFDNWQKGHLLRRVDASNTDWIILADTDEIVSAEMTKGLWEWPGKCLIPEMVLCCHWLNCRRLDFTWRLAKILPFWELELAEFNAAIIRGNQNHPRIPNAGWHFTSLAPWVHEKLASWGHQEYNRPPYNQPETIALAQRERRDLFGRGHLHVVQEDLSFLPRCVQENPEKYAHLLQKADSDVDVS